MTLAWQFAQMSADQQRVCIRRMAADGMTDHDISELIGCGIEAVRTAVADRDPAGSATLLGRSAASQTAERAAIVAV